MINYSLLTKDNLTMYSLDDFVRTQAVNECYRKAENGYELKNVSYTEEWSVEKKRSVCLEIIDAANTKSFAFGAFEGENIVGFIFVKNTELVYFHVSQPYRGKGIGRKLFELACEKARECGAQRLFISANSSKETVDTYLKLGCSFSNRKNEKEPFDIQMEYKL
ncbi:MAG: GNAT family N-acetyltransferase [Clostridia bacterium]|nr:GNAT family N-acetyltransferase [Clostridia bacterium]